MATNLRLRPEAEEAVRREAERTGRSQQDVIRDAIDHHLGLSSTGAPTEVGGEMAAMVRSGAVRRPRNAYRRATKRIVLPKGTTTADLLDRTDRF